MPYDAYATKLAAAIPLGEGPDLYIDSHERLGDYRARRIVAPVGDALEPGVFSLPALEAVSAEGAVWALPLSQKCLALYLNTDLVKGAPEALEDLAELRGKLRKARIRSRTRSKGLTGSRRSSRRSAGVCSTSKTAMASPARPRSRRCSWRGASSIST